MARVRIWTILTELITDIERQNSALGTSYRRAEEYFHREGVTTIATLASVIPHLDADLQFVGLNIIGRTSFTLNNAVVRKLLFSDNGSVGGSAAYYAGLAVRPQLIELAITHVVNNTSPHLQHRLIWFLSHTLAGTQRERIIEVLENHVANKEVDALSRSAAAEGVVIHASRSGAVKIRQVMKWLTGLQRCPQKELRETAKWGIKYLRED